MCPLAYPYIDFQTSTVIHMDIHDFWILANVNIHIDIQAGICMQGHSTMDVHGTLISTNGYLCFYGYQFSVIRAFIDIH